MRAWRFGVFLMLVAALVLATASVALAAPKLIATGGDSADGPGVRIEKSSWYMYNYYYWWHEYVPGESPGHYWGDKTFFLQAGDPKHGANIVGTYTVAPTETGEHVVTYDLYDSVTVNGRSYEPVVVDEHLAVSDGSIMSAKPHKVDNQDFGVPFTGDGEFNVFVYLEIALQ